MIDTIVISCFVVVMILNVIALVRHYMAMRMMMIALNNFVDQQRIFVEWLEEEKRKISLAP